MLVIEIIIFMDDFFWVFFIGVFIMGVGCFISMGYFYIIWFGGGDFDGVDRCYDGLVGGY